MTTDVPLAITVGICAYNEERRIGRCLESLLSQALPPDASIHEILVVASGCTDRTERIVEEWARRDSRVTLVSEPTRNGKASAINLVMARARGDVLVLLNGDALLRPGAMASLLQPFLTDADVQIACGAPVPAPGPPGLARLIVEAQWGLHNRTLQTLSWMNMPNHCCDEFLAMRRGFLKALPPLLVNDGAYLGVEAAIRGISVRFGRDALVEVEIPSSFRGVLAQRRRILRGHRQVRELLHRSPNTLETLFPNDPALALRIVASEALRSLRALLAFLFLLLPMEAAAGSLSSVDRVRGSQYEGIWTPVE